MSIEASLKLLRKELTRLKAETGMGSNLTVVWDPKEQIPREGHGLVRGSAIHIFDMERDEALHTLRHEFWEYVLSCEFLEPRIFEAKAHRRSDAVVDVLAKLI